MGRGGEEQDWTVSGTCSDQAGSGTGILFSVLGHGGKIASTDFRAPLPGPYLGEREKHSPEEPHMVAAAPIQCRGSCFGSTALKEAKQFRIGLPSRKH